MLEYKKIALDLHLFDGGEGGEGAPGAAEGAEAAGAEGTEANAEEADAQSAEEAAKAREDAFEARIKGEDKDLFDKRVQSIVNQRFKESKKLEARAERQQNALNLLASRYPNVDASDPDALMKAMEQDESLLERYAEDNGLTPEMAKKFSKMERDNAMYRTREEQARKQQEAQRIFSKWQAEADSCKQVYGNFNMQQEMQSPATGERFQNLLRNGVDVKTAYEVIHKDELLSGALRTAVQTTQKKVADDIRARGNRPAENGLGAGGGTATTFDASKLTNEQLIKMSEAARSGKRITIDKNGIKGL